MTFFFGSIVSGVSRVLFEPVNRFVSGWLNRFVELDELDELDDDVVSGLTRFLPASVVSNFRFGTGSFLVWFCLGWIDELDDAAKTSSDMSTLEEDASPEPNPHFLGFFLGFFGKLTGPQVMEMARI
jgi:hypothetical protein